jgi:hypothetical protein
VFEEIQQIVDEIADDLRRPVVLEDERHALIAHSAHAHTDPVRQQALLLRQTPPEAIAWVTEHGLLDAQGPLRIRANPRLGAESRVCTPIREDGRLRGFLSVLDPKETLNDEELMQLGQAAETLRQLLHELRVAQEMPLARERELVDTLIADPDAGARAAACAALIDERRLATGPLFAVVIRVARSETDGAHDDQLLSQVIRRERHALPPHSVAATTRPDHIVLVVAQQLLDTSSAAATAERIHRATAGLVAGKVLSAPPLVTFGDPVVEADAVARSYRHALAASRVGEAVAEYGDAPLGWDDLGVYQTLVHVPPDELGVGPMDERIARLLDRAELLQTLETYLDRSSCVGGAGSRLGRWVCAA